MRAHPVYLNSLARLTLNTSIDRSSILFLNIFVFAPNVPLSEESLNVTDGEIDRLIEENIADFYVSRERFLKGSTLLIGTPGGLLPTQTRTWFLGVICSTFPM